MMRFLLFILPALVAIPLSAQHRKVLSVQRDTAAVRDTAAAAEPKPEFVTSTYHRSNLVDSVQIAFKCDPVLLLNGELPVFVEKRLNRYFSVEGALGVTYMDFLYEAGVNGAYFIGNKNAKFRSGFCARAQFRLFPRHADAAISGFYLGPDAAYRTYLMDWYEFTGLLNDVYRSTRKVSELQLVIGWQNADHSDEMFWDAYVAVGLRQTKELRVTEIPNVSLPPAERTRPVVNAGIKLGWGM